MFTMNVPKQIWGEAVLTTTDLIQATIQRMLAMLANQLTATTPNFITVLVTKVLFDKTENWLRLGPCLITLKTVKKLTVSDLFCSKRV